ncbi:MAG: bis(5'-nucleosyl)-tetraphosphatase (symmetrical) YqeK [Ruminococcus sp.]|nr:bis(5'-nucleosyl)-tetraphosphatase (symmetrical) YqeK [Ruminococcus sp.]
MFDKKKICEYKDYLKKNLSKKRYTHSLNVAESALALAERYKADKDKAYVAGLIHDVAKELPTEKQRKLVVNSKLNVSDIETKATPLYHAIAGAELIQTEFGIDDEEIIDAVRYHTVACKDMSKLSQIVYLADLISEDRDYKDVKKMRKYCEQSLEKGMLEALKFSISDSVRKGNSIPCSTLEAYNDFTLLYNKK